MAGTGTQIGSISRIPVFVDRGAVVTGVVLWMLSGAATTSWLLAAAWFPLVFGSILFHELGHAVVARRNSRQVSHIQFTWMRGECHTRGLNLPAVQTRVSLAGPAASLLLAITCFVMSWLPLGQLAVLATYGAWLNLSWTVFNMLPIPPLDGYQALTSFMRRS